MKKEDWKRFLAQSVSGFGSLALAIAFYFLILRFSFLQTSFNKLLRILTPFVYGGILAYLLKKPCNFLERNLEKYLPVKLKRYASGAAILVSVFLLILALYALLAMILPELASSIRMITRVFPRKLDEFTEWIESTLNGNEVLASYINTAVEGIGIRVNTWAKKDLLPMLQDLLGGFTASVTTIIGIVYNLLIGMIVCVYTLGSRKVFARQGKMLLFAVFPEYIANWILDEIKFVDKTFGGFFVGKIIDSAIVGGVCYIICLIMNMTIGLPNPLLISVIVGVTNMIPYFGPYIGLVPSFILIVMHNPLSSVIFVIAVLILQQIDGNILGPRLLANSVGLTGFWVLFSITLFGGLFGFVGILVGVPIFAVIYDLIKRSVLRKLRLRKIKENQYNKT